MSKARTLSIGGVPFSVTDPRLRAFLEALKDKVEAGEGRKGVRSKQPTVQDLIDAGVPNADKIK